MKYRRLKPYEILREGDEFITLAPDRQWLKTQRPGERVGIDLYRRPVPEKPRDHRHVWVVEISWANGDWQPDRMFQTRHMARRARSLVKRLASLQGWQPIVPGCSPNPDGEPKTRIRKYVPEEGDKVMYRKPNSGHVVRDTDQYWNPQSGKWEEATK